MARRRHFGSVRKLPSGRYQASYLHRGQRVLAPETFLERADADEWLILAQAAIVTGRALDPGAGRTPFGQYAGRWLETRLVRGRPLALSTLQGYRALLTRNLLPILAPIPLQMISAEMVREWHAAISRGCSGRSGAPRRHARRVN